MRRLTAREVPVVKQAILQKRQGFRCPLCTGELTVVTGCLDHNHDTGAVRGVLCRNCNGIEGKIRNLVTRARRGTPHEEYLDRVAKYWLLHTVDRTNLMYPTHKTDDEKRIKRNLKARKTRAAKKVSK